MEKDFIQLDHDDIRYLHDDAIQVFGGVKGENEPGYIDYMAEKPFQYSFGQELYPGVFMKAACYLEGFATHQYFSDGNKRTGVMCCITFLLINGYEVDVDDKSLELYRVTMKVCDDSIPRQERWGIKEITEWLQMNCIRNSDFK